MCFTMLEMHSGICQNKREVKRKVSLPEIVKPSISVHIGVKLLHGFGILLTRCFPQAKTLCAVFFLLQNLSNNISDLMKLVWGQMSQYLYGTCILSWLCRKRIAGEWWLLFPSAPVLQHLQFLWEIETFPASESSALLKWSTVSPDSSIPR